METAEATHRMSLLEERYFELNRDMRTVRLQIGDDRDSSSAVQLEARVQENQRQMHAILQEIARVEASLLD